MTPEEARAYERDHRLATSLLFGNNRKGKTDLPTKVEFLSGNTKPTEKEARAALARLLIADALDAELRWALAALLDPEVGQSPRKLRTIIFKNRSQGHPLDARNGAIAYRVLSLMDDEDRSYEEAIDQVAEQIGRDSRHVAKIYANVFSPEYRAGRQKMKRRGTAR